MLGVTINRPEQRNAINMAVAEEIASAMGLPESDLDLSMGIITGAGKRLSAGA